MFHFTENQVFGRGFSDTIFCVMAYGILEGVKGFMEYEMISEKELDRLLEKEQGFVIDLRSPWEYAAYHIPGAVNIPYERLKKVRGLPKNVPLIFYCERGSVSMVAAREMAEKGYRAKSLTGGIHSWHRRLG